MRSRLYYLLLGWGTVGLFYSTAQLTPRLPTPLNETALDAALAFNPNAIGWYLSFFLFIPAAYALVRAELLPVLSRAMQVSGGIAALVFAVYPTSVVAPVIHTHTWGVPWLEFLRQYDSPQNCLPSLHAALTLIAAWGISQNRHKSRLILTTLAAVWSGLIVCSIVQVRRHLVVDVSAGLLLGLLALFLSHKVSK